jgi:hypothetical protein
VAGPVVALTLACLLLTGCGKPETAAPVPGAPTLQPGGGQTGAVSLAPGEYPQPNVSGLTFSPVVFPKSAAQYKSKWAYNAVSVDVAQEGEGLRCDITAPASSAKGVYGGVTFPVAGMKALRLDVTFSNPAGIAVLYVDGYTGAKSEPAVRWEWRNMAGREFTASPHTCTLVPGAGSGWFHASVGSKATAAGVNRVDVFCRVNPGEKAGFVLHKMEVGS